ncbi:MAG: hypothetical protein ACUVQ0_03905 [Thermoproteota archaeon]
MPLRSVTFMPNPSLIHSMLSPSSLMIWPLEASIPNIGSYIRATSQPDAPSNCVTGLKLDSSGQ